jgi:hypothetical protein
MEQHLPSYDELPVKPHYPPGSAWGLWGDEDELGTLNLLTPERVAEAAKLVLLPYRKRVLEGGGD